MGAVGGSGAAHLGRKVERQFGTHNQRVVEGVADEIQMAVAEAHRIRCLRFANVMTVSNAVLDLRSTAAHP